MPVLPVTALTEATLEGGGVFDVLMRANKAHLESEFAKNRIRGPEYATVYLGSLEAVMQASLQFLLQKEKSAAEIALIEAQTALAVQQTANAVIEGTVLTAQECKLRAEYDVLMLQKLKVTTETQLLAQKVVTEQAQTTSMGVDADSVVGKQKALYAAQTSGFQRDAEQKVADLMMKTWNTRRMTDEATVASDTPINGSPPNYLGDGSIGRAVNKLLAGINA